MVELQEEEKEKEKEIDAAAHGNAGVQEDEEVDRNITPPTISPVRHVEFNLSPMFRRASSGGQAEEHDDGPPNLARRSSISSSSPLGGRTALESRIYERTAVLQFQYELFGFGDDDDENVLPKEDEEDGTDSNSNSNIHNEHHHHHHNSHNHHITRDSQFGLSRKDVSELWQPAVSNRRRSFSGSTVDEFMDKAEKDKLIERTELVKRFLHDMKEVIRFDYEQNVSMEVRLHNVSFFVPYDDNKKSDGNSIHTVWNQTLLYHVLQFFQRLRAVTRREVPRLFPQPAYRPILSDVSLCLKPGKMYLILGAPSSGKTTLLKAIAGLLPNNRVLAGKNKGQPRPNLPYLQGSVEYNGHKMERRKKIFLRNAISFIDQLERHAPRLTVRETFEFAFQCLSGGTHRPPGFQNTSAGGGISSPFDAMDKKHVLLQYTMEMLGLSHVADTFVGDSNVRGISGGQRRRVTVGEMLQSIPGASVMCADEVSNGLDSRSTFAIINYLAELSKINRRTRVISLLQPSPETFSLFDEVIILAEGHIIYAGPIDQVVQYFEDLGYPLPKRMDVADYLQTVSTPDGAELFKPPPGSSQTTHYTAEGFAKAFQSSGLGQKIQQNLASPHPHPWLSFNVDGPMDEELAMVTQPNHHIPMQLRIQYRNSFLRSTWLVMKRHFTMWIRDRRFVIANFVKNLVMGLSVGMVFYQTNAPAQIYGALFQSMLFIMLGAMTSAPAQIDDRIIYYKQSDANFYQTFAFTWGRFLALTPQAALDVLTFGTILYWMIGLIPAASNFFIFIAVLFTFNLSMNSMFGSFASILSNKAGVQGAASIILFIATLFGGFIVAPSVIPNYYSWLYWWNPFAWAYRALAVNAFASESFIVNPAYDNPVYLNNVGLNNNKTTVSGYFTQGQIVLWAWGFTNPDGLPFDEAWVGYGFAYLVPYALLCTLLIGVGLKYVRIEIRQSTVDKNVEDDGNDFQAESLNVPFTPVDLVFENICYEVPASTGSGSLKLLNNVTGTLKSGRMCALMGSSGAGKTTLMDVLALRKSTGTITGQVLVNGFEQEKNSFRRCSGYVEQFDVQSPELTVKETIEFSANLRIDPSNLNGMEVGQFVDSIIKMFELTPLKDAQVGTTDEGGLSFEQRKRLSIAVEFAASPSILFLDEPTTGLDSRAAMLVMQSLKRVVATGRTVCATIHQPSSAVFTMFDDLLLLRKGGEVVFHGELGSDSVNLVNYFEQNGAHALEYGTNPASWMLTVLDDETKDWCVLYRNSEERRQMQRDIDELKDSAVEAKMISYETVYARTFLARNRFMNRRLNLIYWRSPVYNLGRVLMSLAISFILASVFITTRHQPDYTELEMQGRLSIIFLSFIIMGVLSMITILPTTLSIRDVYYRHHLAGMLEYTTLTLGFAVAEKPFLIIVSTLFVVIFYITLGLALNLRKFGAFWGFFTFNIAIYSYFGQAFMCLVPGMATAQILCSIFIGINNFFSGLIVRPQYLSGFWALPFWLTPGHYVFEGLVASQFFNDETMVLATPMSPFFQYLNCTLGNQTVVSEPCVGTVEQYVLAFFGGKYQYDHIFYDAIALGIFLIFARALTYFALKKYNFAAT